MIEIDGAQGEGGGQIVRSSLALSLLTGKSFRIFNLRSGRKKPGLKLQHLTAVSAAAEIGNANVIGAELGSCEIRFEPGKVAPGEFHFSIATAGSINLVLQTVLPALMMADAPSKLTLAGGTHNQLAPPFDFLLHSYLPLLNQMGPQVEMKLNRHGFYPAGGGEFEATVDPDQNMSGLQIRERGKLIRRRVRSIVSSLPIEIAERETKRVVRKMNWDRTIEEHVDAPNPAGPGNVLFVELEFENLTTVFSGFGRRGVSAEQVADSVVRAVRSYLKTDAPVGPHLADQLMLPMAIAAEFSDAKSAFRTGALTQHALTHANILCRFLDVEIAVNEQSDGSTIVSMS